MTGQICFSGIRTMVGKCGGSRSIQPCGSAKTREGDVPVETSVISRVQPTRGALHRDGEKRGFKGLLRSDTQNVSLGYPKNTEVNCQHGKHGRSRCEGELGLSA